MERHTRNSPEFRRIHTKNDAKRTAEVGGVFPRPFVHNVELLQLFQEKIAARKAAEEQRLLPRSGPEPFTTRELGRLPMEDEPELPVRAFKDRILESVRDNQVTIITAETGAGKSTQVPQYLMEAGYHVSMTQPRRISASFVAERIQDEVVAVLGDEIEHAHDLVGYHTAARNTTVEGKTRIEVVTDGLRLVQQFGHRDELQNEVLIIDEAHEWNNNIEMLIARARQLLQEKPELRVIIMSATIEAEKLAQYFSSATGKPTPILNVPGRNHQVTRFERPDSTVVNEVMRYVDEGENILVFLPGVQEIKDAINEVGKRLAERNITDVVLLPLHSKVSPQEEDAVKGHYPGPKIIFATNIAQTSITIPDVNVVIDSGLERRKEIDDQMIEGLHLRSASRADMNQRAGRTGRVAPGIYVHTRLDARQPFVGFHDESRTDYPIPEILRTNVNGSTLLAASIDIDLYKLGLFHEVQRSIIKKAKQSLTNIGALDRDGVITPRGMRMNRLPMRPEYARMIIESEDKGYPMTVRHQVAAMTAAMEAGGLTSWVEGASRAWRELSNEEDSDLVTQLEVFTQTRDKDNAELVELGLDISNMERAREQYGKLVRRLSLSYGDDELTLPTPDERKMLTTAITAGLVNHVYRKVNSDTYVAVDRQTDRERRKLSGRTTIPKIPLPPELVVGTPYRVEKRRSGGTVTEHVIQDATATTRQALAQSAIELLTWEDGGTRMSNGRLRRVRHQFFRGVIDLGISLEEDAKSSHETTKEIIHHMINKSGPSLIKLKAIKKELESLQHRTREPLPLITSQDMAKLIEAAIDPDNLDVNYTDFRIGQLMIEANISLDSLLPPEKRQDILRNAPDEIIYAGNEWKVEYRNGVPRIRLHDLNDATTWTTPPRLDDGREVKLMYERRTYKFDDLQKGLKANKLS